jgi:uncharacterized membrane protein
MISGPSFFISNSLFWPKNAYKRVPYVSRQKSDVETSKNQNRDRTNEDSRGNPARATTRGISTFSYISTIITMMKRELSSSRLRVCGSSLISLSLPLSICLSLSLIYQWSSILWSGDMIMVVYVIHIWWIFILWVDIWDWNPIMCKMYE